MEIFPLVLTYFLPNQGSIIEILKYKRFDLPNKLDWIFG